jgi:hypothetical protein
VLGKVAQTYQAAEQAAAGRLATDPGRPVVDLIMVASPH